jgi:hypothetical protein
LIKVYLVLAQGSPFAFITTVLKERCGDFKAVKLIQSVRQTIRGTRNTTMKKP